MNYLFEKEPICFADADQNVWKYVFHFEGAIAEAVLYRYKSFEDRTVLCVSVQSGCPCGCRFCGTGEKFIRNLKDAEIVSQVQYILNDKGIATENCQKFQIMFMSMGEPFLNYTSVSSAIEVLSFNYPNAQLLVSTIGPSRPSAFDKFIKLSVRIPNVGLQLSIHRSNDEDRYKLIPFASKFDLVELRDYGVQWWHETGRKVYLNYCIDGTNNTVKDLNALRTLFPPSVFCFTFSVVCSKDETMKDAGYRNLDAIRDFERYFSREGYDTRIFNPAGQDSIGGGCGQLFYVQQWMKANKEQVYV